MSVSNRAIASVSRVLLMLPLLMAVLGCGARVKGAAQPQNESGRIIVQYQHTAPEAPPAAIYVWRSDAPEGPFRQLTAKPIPYLHTKDSSPTAQTVMIDRNLPMGQTYYYYLESSDSQGNRRKITGIVPAKVTIRGEGK